MKRLAFALLAGCALPLAACNQPDNATEAASSTAADAQINAAGNSLSNAAVHAGSGLKAAGADLLSHTKDAAADAASEVSTDAAKASRDLHKDADKHSDN